MAQLLPDKDKQGPLAWMLLLGALFLVYWIGFSWYFERRAELSEQADTLLESEARFNGLIAQRAELETALAEVRDYQAGNDYFLPEATGALASSALTTRLKALIGEHAEDAEDCKVMSNKPARSSGKPGRFERVAINVQMRCNIGDVARVFYYMENETPYKFVDNLNIQKRSTRRRQGREVVTDEYLDVKFDLAGYIR